MQKMNYTNKEYKKINKVISDYDWENDILYMNWGGEGEGSMECFNGSLVLDVNKKGEIVGFELFDFNKEYKRSRKKLLKLFKNSQQTKTTISVGSRPTDSGKHKSPRGDYIAKARNKTADKNSLKVAHKTNKADANSGNKNYWEAPATQSELINKKRKSRNKIEVGKLTNE